MYTGFGFREFVIGDVDVIKVGDTYHLFHLVLPNHDFIAHAVSQDGITWTRVKNAFFIGDPDSWDDDMLWTMHVSPDPHRQGAWRMFYTGLSRAEAGRIQRVGLARSDDLYNWTKDESGQYPIQIEGEPYETLPDDNRYWVSFRDPFLFTENGKRYLLASGRVNHGPMIRRGCVSLAEEVEPDVFAFREPLHHPGQYDEIEVPGMVKLDGRYYLIGSIREDVKVRYWFADEALGPFCNFFDNTLLPQGNYAARPSLDGDKALVWNFFSKPSASTSPQQLLPPPKELEVVDDGRLRLRSFHGFDKLVTETLDIDDLTPVDPLLGQLEAEDEVRGGRCWMGSPHGFEAFLFHGEFDDFRMRTKLEMRGRGKCGLVFRLDDEGHGYFISMDLIKGLVQLRSWCEAKSPLSRQSFSFRPLQSANFISDRMGPWELRLIALGTYLEFSINEHVLLTLADDTFDRGRVGFYCEGSEIRLHEPVVELFRNGMEAGYLPVQM